MYVVQAAAEARMYCSPEYRVHVDHEHFDRRHNREMIYVKQKLEASPHYLALP